MNGQSACYSESTFSTRHMRIGMWKSGSYRIMGGDFEMNLDRQETCLKSRLGATRPSMLFHIMHENMKLKRDKFEGLTVIIL